MAEWVWARTEKRRGSEAGAEVGGMWMGEEREEWNGMVEGEGEGEGEGKKGKREGGYMKSKD